MLLAWIRVEVVLLLLYIEWLTIEVAVGREQRINPLVLIAVVVAAIGTTVFLIGRR